MKLLPAAFAGRSTQTLLRAQFKVLITSVRNADWENAYRFSLPMLRDAHNRLISYISYDYYII